MGDKMKILLTGVGCPGVKGTIYSLKNNPKKKAVFILGTDIDKEAVGKAFTDAFHSVPPPEKEETYISVLQTLCKINDIDIIVPQTTREVTVLSKHRNTFLKNNVKVLVGTERAIKISNSKLGVLNVFEKLGLPTPSYHVARNMYQLQMAIAMLGYPTLPVIVKPLHSSGMRGVRLVREDAWSEKRFFSEKPDGLEITLFDLQKTLFHDNWKENLIIMEYLPGKEYSVDVFKGREKIVVIPRLRKKIRSGISFVTEICQDESMEHQSLAFMKEVGLTGVVGFQYKLNSDGEPRILECNPRIQGTMVASTFAGRNVIWYAIEEMMYGKTEIEFCPIRQITFSRYWGGVCNGKQI